MGKKTGRKAGRAAGSKGKKAARPTDKTAAASKHPKAASPSSAILLTPDSIHVLPPEPAMRFKILQPQSSLRQYRIVTGAKGPMALVRSWLSRRKL